MLSTIVSLDFPEQLASSCNKDETLFFLAVIYHFFFEINLFLHSNRSSLCLLPSCSPLTTTYNPMLRRTFMNLVALLSLKNLPSIREYSVQGEKLHSNDVNFWNNQPQPMSVVWRVQVCFLEMFSSLTQVTVDVNFSARCVKGTRHLYLVVLRS